MRDNPEHRLSFWTAKLVAAVVAEPAWATAVDHSGAAIGKSEQAAMVWAQRRRAMGIRPAHLDWYVWQQETGVYTQFELKVKGGSLTDGQRATMALLQERGIPTACCWSIGDVLVHLQTAGFRLVENAAAIAAEIEAKHQARERTAQRTQAPRTRQRKQAAKPAAYAVPPELGDVFPDMAL